MATVSREEKLILQMKNIEAIVTSDKAAAEKVFMVTQQMSFLNELVNNIIQPFRDEAGEHHLIEMANSTFVDFVPSDKDYWEE
jgi:hypothetical protein